MNRKGIFLTALPARSNCSGAKAVIKNSGTALTLKEKKSGFLPSGGMISAREDLLVSSVNEDGRQIKMIWAWIGKVAGTAASMIILTGIMISAYQTGKENWRSAGIMRTVGAVMVMALAILFSIVAFWVRYWFIALIFLLAGSGVYRHILMFGKKEKDPLGGSPNE